jgi:hypothetical protein
MKICASSRSTGTIIVVFGWKNCGKLVFNIESELPRNPSQVNSEVPAHFAKCAVKRVTRPTVVMIGMAKYVTVILTTNAVEEFPARRSHGAKASGEFGLTVQLPQFGCQKMPDFHN